MKDSGRTKEHLIEELASLRHRISAMKALESERKHTEESLRKLSQAVEQSPSMVVITDIKGNIEYVNPKFTQLTGYTFKEAIGKTPRILKSGKTPPEVYKQLWKTITSGGEWRGEFCNKKKNGELYWEDASISPIRSKEGVITHFVAVKEDITERKLEEAQFKRMAYHDALTELPNRILFSDRLTLEIAHAHRNKEMLAVMYIDLDKFKDINDT
ncbi:MAG: PAS domain-containing protein, partial [Candidatus Brocadiales bacterium]